jgi:serine/threonine protein kinase
MDFNTNQEINNRYRLIKPIGRGSFGEVWLAEDKNLGFNVALKIYVALDNKGLDEFKNEFKNVYYLHHPNLLKADYYDTIGNNPYLVMQYCPESAGDLAGNMSEAEIWKFIKDVASGLSYLHNNDIVHRDIKPDNILKDSMGNYVITDFGLSIKMRSTLRKASGRFNNTADQSGTVGYMAPEMFAARPNIVKATDIWALGVTIYELATGELPFCGQGGVMELHGAELPILPDQYSKELNELMKRCLAKDTWDRPSAMDIISGKFKADIPEVSKPQNNENDVFNDDRVQNLSKVIEGATDDSDSINKNFRLDLVLRIFVIILSFVLLPFENAIGGIKQIEYNSSGYYLVLVFGLFTLSSAGYFLFNKSNILIRRWNSYSLIYGELLFISLYYSMFRNHLEFSYLSMGLFIDIILLYTLKRKANSFQLDKELPLVTLGIFLLCNDDYISIWLEKENYNFLYYFLDRISIECQYDLITLIWAGYLLYKRKSLSDTCWKKHRIICCILFVFSYFIEIFEWKWFSFSISLLVLYLILLFAKKSLVFKPFKINF